MSLFELLPKLRPRKFEPVFHRDLHQLFMNAKRLGPIRSRKDATRIIRDDIFKAFLGGKLQATRELKERYSYSIGDYDLAVIQEMRQRYISDFNAILNDLFRGVEQAKLLQRVWAVAVTATWEAYNKGKISTYRQDDEGKIRERGYAAQAHFEPVVYWITAARSLREKAAAGVSGELLRRCLVILVAAASGSMWKDRVLLQPTSL